MVKMCHKCKTKKTLDNFSKDKNKKDGLSYYCKKCFKEYIYEYRKIHGRVEEFKKFSEKRRLFGRNDNPETIKIWKQENRDKVNLYRRKRRILEKETSDKTINKKSLQEMLEKQEYKCNICKNNINNKKHTDHIIPMCRGGKHSILNIQLLCPSCNLKKGIS